MSGKKVTVRKQKIKKNHIREKLIFFTVLTLILLIVAAIARKLCPYDPYAQDLFVSAEATERRTYSGDRPLRKRYVFESSGGKYNKYLCDASACFNCYGYGNSDWTDLWMVWRNCRYSADAYFRFIPCISKSCFCTGSCRSPGWGNTECDHCTGGDRMAEVCKTCKRTDTGAERFAVSDGSKNVRQQCAENPF